jgi:hypothetical protein
MATNREMLKEAIAEAKAVKEMAIANAKAALEETFTPQLKSILSTKLQEMATEEDELEEAGFGPMINVKGHGNIEDNSSLYEDEVEEGEGENMYEVDLEELLAELTTEENLNEGEEGEDEVEATEDVDLSDDELKEMIEDVLAQMIKDGEIEAGPNFESEEGKESEDEETEESEEEVDLAELLREIEEMEEPVDEVSFRGLLKPRSVKEFEADYPGLLDKAKAAKDEKEKISILSNAMDKFKDEYIKDTGVGVANAAIAKVWEFVGVNPATIASYGPEGRGGAKMNESEEMKAELKEALSTIKTLKTELNEINLLNAKLLYSNKIFKAKNLNENQKVKVLSSFDKATNVGEVKMVFETLNEGIKVKKETIKENLGRASKATNIPTAKQPIVESNDVFKRMQKLAGLI